MSRTPAAREKHKFAEAQRRQAKLQRAIDTAAATERHDEQITPAVLRATIIDISGAVLRGPLVRIVNGRPCRATGLCDDAIDRAASNKAMTPARIAAARLFQADLSEAGGGIIAGAVDYSSAGGGGGDGDGRHAGILAQIKARGRLEGALATMGALGPVVVRVVLDSVSPTSIAKERGCERVAVFGFLIAGLDKLAGFYRAGQNANVGVADEIVIGPARVRRAA